jgi:hypothetical protein
MMPIIPIEGIDKIKVFLNPFLVDYNKLKVAKHIDPQNQLTLHQSGWFTSLAIHAEFFNPMGDYYLTIAMAVHELIKKEIITFPDCFFTPMFVYRHLDWFVIGVQEVEFYFDIKPDNINVAGDAVENGDLIKVDHGYYTRDYKKGKHKRKSIGVIYDKAEKNRHDNHIKHEIIEEYPYKTRLEFRLTNRNCGYLNLKNFRGDYLTIIKHFRVFLAIQYGLYFDNCVKISGRNNKQLGRIEKKSVNAGQRYRGKELKKALPIKVAQNARDDEGRIQMQKMFLRQFYREKNEAGKDQS